MLGKWRWFWLLGWPAAALVVADAWRWRWFTHPDMGLARAAADVLLSARALDLYALAPLAQMGPLAIAMAEMPHELYNVVVGAMALPFLLLASRPLWEPGVGWLRRAGWVLASLLLVAPWAQLAWKGHADDALVLLGAGVMVAAVRRRRRGWLLVGWVVAVAGKPTALALAPLLLASPATLLVAVVLTGLIWGPFAAADPGAMLRAGQGVMPVVPGDGLAYIGVHPGRPPGWVRPVQLLVSWTGTLLGFLRDQPAAGVLMGLTARAVFEPNPAPAYSISLVALALFVDAERRVPAATVLAACGFWTSQWVLEGGSGLPRILSLMALVAWAAWLVSGKVLQLHQAALQRLQAGALRGISTVTATALCGVVLAAPVHAQALKQGSLGDPVRCVQWAVNRLLPDDPWAGTPVQVDGVYGQGTIRATYTLQADLYASIDSHELDGWVGPLTGTILHRAGFQDAPPQWHCDTAVPFDPLLVSEADLRLRQLYAARPGRAWSVKPSSGVDRQIARALDGAHARG
jgi:hypothetical protein